MKPGHINHITEISRSKITRLDFHQKESHAAETKKYKNEPETKNDYNTC
jgi:hypothetical protein